MNKRRIALLAGLMTMGMVSFAMEEGNAEVLKTQEQKELSIFNINDRVRFDENRLEVNGNLHLDENNRLEMRVRNYTGVGSDANSSRSSGKETSDRTEVRLRLHTQTSVENMEIRTEVKTNTYENSGSKQLFRVQPTWHLFTDVDGLDSLVRAGVGMEHSGDAHGEDYMITTSFENYYTINDYFAIEGNVYYDYTFGGDGATDGQYHNVEIEAYAYANYPLYQNDDMKVEALFEGGLDPYGFGNRHFDDLNDVNKDNNKNGEDYYVVYLEPSVKVTKHLNETNNVYLQGGYYIEKNEENTSSNYDDTAFVRVGFTSKF
ncbi:FomA family porin-like outer membrane protein [Psychrilyobacter atlanticus]|uniref:FomA family porin-like outer membrane protein n=1 Tax=Psychrilyobacter atlanticus TaxID=271091 RepID=UPI00041656D5|nr:hypothetical protein [Psychrilyobacter atlanticus]